MFFSHPEIRAILMDAFHYTEAEMDTLQFQYTSGLSKYLLDEIMLYIEQHNLPENDELKKLLSENKARRGNPETETMLLRFIGAIPAKYPEMVTHLQEQVAIFDEEMTGDFIRALDEKSAIKVLEIINKDLTNMETFSDKYLNPNKASVTAPVK